MDTIKKLNSQQRLKKIDWKIFFDMRLFRYTFLKQLKSVSTYVFFILTFIASGLIMYGSFSIVEDIFRISDFNDLEADALSNFTSSFFQMFKMFLYMIFMLLFPIFIGFKSLQIFRDEIDDGTLLILSSMPFTRFKLIFQKWLSLQVICLVFTLTVIFVSPVLFLSIQGFSKPSQEVTKVLFGNSFSLILASIIFQLLVSTFAVFLSLVFGKTGTIGFLVLFTSVLLVLKFVPSIVQVSILGFSNSRNLYDKISSLGRLSDKGNLFQYYGDSDLKDFFELENWYTNQELENKRQGSNFYYDGNENKKDFNLTFESSFIVEFADLINSKNNNDFSKKKQDFLEKKIKVIDINYNSPTPKAIQKFLDLLKKVMPQTINLCPIDVRYKESHRSYEFNPINDGNILKLYETRNYDLIKSYDGYKTALDNNKSLTEKEKKIVNLSKSFFEILQKVYSDDVSVSKLTFIQHNRNTQMFIESLAKQYLNNQKIPNSDMHKYNEIIKNINELLINDERGTNKSIAYFIDNDAFQNINFLMKELYLLTQEMNHFSISQEDIGKVDKFLKIIKINNYLNIITQMQFIWDGENKRNIPEFSQPNYYGKWELKEINYKKQDGTQETNKYAKINPTSFKKIINKNILCIVYPIISLGLISLLILMVYRKDFA